MGECPLWVVLSGVVTLLLGLIILNHWPVSSLYILGLLLGIDLLFAGASWIGMGLSLRKAACRVCPLSANSGHRE